MVPVRSVRERTNCRKFWQFPISVGIVPVDEVSRSQNVSRLVRRPTVVEIRPVKPFPSNKDCSVNEPKDIRVCETYYRRRQNGWAHLIFDLPSFVKLEKSGKGPVNSLLPTLMYSKLLIDSIAELGKGPLNPA